jgi:prolyl oligopeptidase
MYPQINKKIAIDNYFEKEVIDEYRNLENLEDSLTINWLKNQNKLSDSVLNKIDSRKQLLTKKNTINSNKKQVISKLKVTQNNFYFYLKKEPNEEVAKLYYRENFSGEEMFLFNPKNYDSLSKINYIQPSWDNSKIVIGLSSNDKEFSKLVTLNLKSKKLFKGEAINSNPNSFGGVEWLPDNSGFIYTYAPEVDVKKKKYLLNTKSVIYKIGNPPNKLTSVLSKENNAEIPFNEESTPIVYILDPESEIILGVNVSGTSRYRDTYYGRTSDLKQGKVNWNFYYGKEEKISKFHLTNEHFYFLTSKNASNFKLCRVLLLKPNFKNPEVLVKEDSISIISDFTVTNKGLFYVKTKNGVEAKLYRLNKITNKHKELKLPKLSGYINVKSNGYKNEDLFIEIEGWVNKKERYKYNFNSSEFQSDNIAIIEQHEELNDVIIEEIEILSHDGVMVPLSIVYKKNVKNKKNNRLLINAYGAYKWSNSPYLYPYLLEWVKEGGVYATAHVRGGGEKGDAWHKAGFKTTKPNTWKDLIACTEYLINNNYASKDKTVVWGASAGGVCVGRAITERPNLFAAAIIRVGVLNALRREFGINGMRNTKEYGTVKDSIEFKALLEMDAYHSIKKDTHYPALYLTAGLNDSRVPAWQPAKFAAKLQEYSTSEKPILFNVDFNGGHGFEASENKQNIELSNIMSFAFWQTGHPDYQPKK